MTYEVEIIYLDKDKMYVSREFWQHIPKEAATKFYSGLLHTNLPSLVVMRSFDKGLWCMVRNAYNDAARKLWK